MQDSAADRNVAELHDELCAAHPTSNGRWSGSSKVLYTYDNKNGNDGGRPTSLALIPLGLAKALAQAWDRPGGVETRLGTGLERFGTGSEQAWNKLGTGLEQAWNRLGTGPEPFKNLERAWNTLGTSLEQLSTGLEQAWNRLGTCLERARNHLKTWNRLGTAMEHAWNSLLGAGLERAWNHSKTWNRLGTCLEQAWNSLEQAWNRLGTGLEQAWNGPGAIHELGTGAQGKV